MPKPIIGVMGGTDADDHVLRMAEQLGALIAEKGWILLNGGRNTGVMAASARGAKNAGGMTLGILPGTDTRGASPDLDIPIITGLGDARNLINVLTPNVDIACPGGAGTISEIAFALKNNKPVIALDFDLGAAFARYRDSGLLIGADSASNAVNCVASWLADH